MTEIEAFEQFVRDYQDMVYTTAYRFLGREAEARDAAQEVFLRAWNHFSELGERQTAGGWLKTVTRNICLNHLERYRSRWRFFSELKSEDANDSDEGFEATFAAEDVLEPALMSADQRELIEEAMAELPAAQRVALVLYHFDDMDYGEIATRLGASLGKVKTDIHRARRSLFRKLQPRREELGV